jgi:cell wall-associated NlpC family hydrolase
MRKAKRISRSSARKGDLVFFRGGRGAYHVGIYAGGNKVLHSPRPGGRVGTVNIWSRNVSFGRVL